MEIIANAASWILIVLGSFFLVAGALGMLRMPDVYTRMHAASVIDTLGATFLILGFAIQAGFTLIAFKLFVVLALLFFFGPVASHALAQAALHAGVEPILNEDRRTRDLPDAKPSTDAPSNSTEEESAS